MIKILKRFFAFCQKENRDKFYASIVLVLCQELFGIMKIGAIYILINAILEETISYHTIYQVLAVMAVSLTGSCLVKNKSTLLQTQAGYSACADKRIDIARHLRYVPMGYFNKKSLGQTVSVCTNTLQTLEGVATRVVMVVSKALLSTFVIEIMILVFNWKIGLITLAGIVVFFIANGAMQHAADKLAPVKAKADSELVTQVMEYIQGIAEVKEFNLTGSKCKMLNDANIQSQKINYKMECRFVPFVFLQNSLIKLIGFLISLVSIWFYLCGTMTLSICIMMIIASFMMLSALDSCSSYSALLHSVDVTVDQVEKIMATPEMNVSGKDIAKVIKTDGNGITLRNVGFSYEKRKIIDGVSFDIPEKTTTAIVGPSGGGKSTITSLISRFWDVDEGEILFDGINIKDYDYDELLKKFSFVFQNVYLFKDTIANNIRFGQENQGMDKVIEAAKKACCHDFIMNLPKGYDTVIGEDGINLSGGERQRISIARAIMKDSPVIILDEATANVDPESEAELIKAINSLTKEKTVIMIAHRLKTVRNASQIIVIDRGRISQKGTHEELMKQDGIYRSFIEGRKKAVSWKL